MKNDSPDTPMAANEGCTMGTWLNRGASGGVAGAERSDVHYTHRLKPEIPDTPSAQVGASSRRTFGVPKFVPGLKGYRNP
jgi:hypothetical protein